MDFNFGGEDPRFEIQCWVIASPVRRPVHLPESKATARDVDRAAGNVLPWLYLGMTPKTVDWVIVWSYL